MRRAATIRRTHPWNAYVSTINHLFGEICQELEYLATGFFGTRQSGRKEDYVLCNGCDAMRIDACRCHRSIELLCRSLNFVLTFTARCLPNFRRQAHHLPIEPQKTTSPHLTKSPHLYLSICWANKQLFREQAEPMHLPNLYRPGMYSPPFSYIWLD